MPKWWWNPIYVKEFALGLKKLRDNKAFGSETAEKFFVGDLVSWTIFNSKDEDGNLTKLTGHGILMNIVHNFLGDREVVFGKVSPLNWNTYNKYKESWN